MIFTTTYYHKGIQYFGPDVIAASFEEAESKVKNTPYSVLGQVDCYVDEATGEVTPPKEQLDSLNLFLDLLGSDVET